MSIPGLNEWLRTPQGRYVLAWEQSKYDEVVADIFGFNALQLGMTECAFLHANRMPLRLSCDVQGTAQVRATAEQLPFASASLDLWCCPMYWSFPPIRTRSCGRSNGCWFRKGRWW